VPALEDVTFTIARGECVAILGQNASGKSTLVRLLSTLLLHDGGSARIFGHDAFANPRAVRRLVNRVSVEASLFTVSVLPQWMEWLATISPATYALRGIRGAILDGAGVGALWGDIWPLLVIGAVAIPLGLAVFRRGETYAKRHGKLKRSG
jgi:hypothetical protein